MNSVHDAASHLGLSDVRVRQLIKSGALDADRVGGRWVIGDDALKAYRVGPLTDRGNRPPRGDSYGWPWNAPLHG